MIEKKENVLPLNEADDLIQYKEKKISDLMLELNDLENEFKSAETIYNEAKAKLEIKRQQVLDAEKSLSILVGLRNGDINLKNIKVYSKISNTVPKIKTRGKKEFNWIKEALAHLNEQQKFMKVETLIQGIFVKNVGWKGKLEKKFNTPSKMTSHISKISTKFTEAASSKKPNRKFVLYQNKIGLPEWVDNNGKPKDKFIKSAILSQ
jgi:hypothetical protein